MIVSSPDAPTNLIEVTSDRTASTLGLSWIEGAFNGGSTVIDYRISYAA